MFNILKKPYSQSAIDRAKLSFLSVIIIGLLVHVYKFTNTLPNHDALFSLYTSNNVISSGRWLLAVASTPSSFYDLPWINGILSLLWIGLTAVIISDFYDFKSKSQTVIASALLVSFPAVVNTFIFEFTADAYFLAMLLSAIGARLIVFSNNKPIRLFLAAVFICLSCGIYQAYLSFALLMSVSHLLLEIVKGKRNNKECLRWVLNQIIVYALALVMYLVAWKICLAAQGVVLSSYLGIDAVASQGLFAGLVFKLKSALQSFAYFFLSRNVFTYGWTLYAVLNCIFLCCLGFMLVFVFFRSKVFKRKLQLVLFVLATAAIPVFACIWQFVSQDVSYHLVMMQSFVVLYIFTIALSSELDKPVFKQFVCVLLAFICIKFSIQANQVYFEMNRTIENSRATGIEMISRIHQMDDGSIDKIALIGTVERSLAASGNSYHDEIMVHAHQVRTNLVYDHIYGNLWLNAFAGSYYTPVSSDELNKLSEDEHIRNMPSWPLKDSIQIIDNIVVVKLSDVKSQNVY